jgi:prevent-host-death family protein
MSDMRRQTVSAAQARRRFSALLSRVAARGESIVIERHGEPLARLVPLGRPRKSSLADVRGWLKDSDPFFATIDRIVARRHHGHPRGMPPSRRRQR